MKKKKVNTETDDALHGVLSGKHICLFYPTKKDLFDLVVPYFREGLNLNRFCTWVVAKPIGTKEAQAVLSKRIEDFDIAMEKGQFEILDYKDWYLDSGKFNPKKVLEGWLKKEKQALKQGFSGLRASGDLSWLQEKDWKKFVNYEKMLEKLIPKTQTIALCTYPIRKVDVADVLVLANNHRFAFCIRNKKWHIIKNVKLGNVLFNIKYFLKK
jgi:hypothetical protein